MSLITKEIKNEEEKQEWTREEEILLAKWADKASCYRWLHDNAEKKYTRLNNFIQIPIIILSTLTGAVSVGSDSIFPPSLKEQSGIILGSVSILTGIIGTIGNFLRYAQLMEAHKIAAIQWSKFQRNIAAELAIHPDNRQPANEFFTICRAELDRLVEQSPSLPIDIINAFETKFKKTKISKPEVCNVLEPIDIYKPHDGEDWVKSLKEKKKNTTENFTINDKTDNKDTINVSAKELSSKDEMIITFDNNSPKKRFSTDKSEINSDDEIKKKSKTELEEKLHNSILSSLNK